MKYHLRFFLDNGQEMSEQLCFATVDSGHVPSDGDLVYIGDEAVDTTHIKVEHGTIYRVKERVFCYNDYDGAEDQLTSVEISVEKTDK